MAMNLQTRSGLPPLADLATAISGWLADRIDATTNLENLRRVEGAGSTSATLLAELNRNGALEHVVVKVLPSGQRPYLDARLSRQVGILSWLSRNTTLPVAEIIAADPDATLMGQPFLIMKRIDGEAPLDFPGYNESGFLCAMDQTQRRMLWQSALDTLVAIHRIDASGIDFLDFPGRRGAGLADLVEHWMASYEWADADIDWTFFDDVARWLRRETPRHAPVGLSWGDARIGNMLFERQRCVAVLDWEMCSLGGPLVDLAWWLLFDRIHDEDLGVKRLDGLGSRHETLERWSDGTSLPLEGFGWHEVFALFQLSITRAKSFGDRARAGLPTPAPDDARSVRRLQNRISDLFDQL